MWYAAAYLGLVAVTSIASLAAYGLDKRRAAVGGRRVPDRHRVGMNTVGQSKAMRDVAFLD